MNITVNFPAAEETSSNPEEGASTEETKREEIRRGKEREKPEEEEGEQKQKGATDISQAGLNLIASYEGCSLKVYKDVAGIETIGYGHVVLPGEDFSKEITHKKALEFLHQDAEEAIRGVRSQVKVPLLQHQFDALVSFTFNVGSKALKESRLLKLINSRDMASEKIREAFLRFRKAKIDGVLTDVQGLVNRREKEANLFLEGVYEK
ncbi:MAG: lysozyme [Candidatus Amoebophilus sp.]